MPNTTSLTKLCDVASIRLHSAPEGYGALVLSLGEVDALTNLFRMEDDGFYLQSDMLGETPLYFSWDDLTTLMSDLMENMQDMPMMGTMMGPEQMQAMMDGSMTEEQALAMMGVDEELMSFISDVDAAKIVETGAFSLEGSDIADQKIVTVLTNEDLIRAVNMPIVRKQIVSQLQMSSPEMTVEEIGAEVDAEIADISQTIQDANLSATSTVYQANGEFVAYELLIIGNETYNDTVSEASISVTVTKTSIDTAEFYQLSVRLREDGDEFQNQYGSLYIDGEFISGKYLFNDYDDEPVFSASFNCDTSADDHTIGELSFTVYDGYYGATSVLVVFDQSKNENVTDTVIDLYAGGAVDDIKASLNTTDVISLKFHTVSQADSGLFNALRNATPETSVQLTQMTEDETAAYLEGMQQNFMTTLMTVMNNLPPDISNSLMQVMGT